MVRHHLLLPHTATRRDLEDPATVTRVVKTLDGNSLLLDLLEALAEADSLATGPGVWSPWKRTLISDLVRRSRALLAGEPLPAPSTPSASALVLAAGVAADGRPQIQVGPGADPPTVLVAVPDRLGVAGRRGRGAGAALAGGARGRAEHGQRGGPAHSSRCRRGSVGCRTRPCCARS